jgi:hypothetical protein
MSGNRESLYNVLVKASFLNKKYSDMEYVKACTQGIINLIEKYHRLIGKMKEFREKVRESKDGES